MFWVVGVGFFIVMAARRRVQDCMVIMGNLWRDAAARRLAAGLRSGGWRRWDCCASFGGGGARRLLSTAIESGRGLQLDFLD